MHRIRYYSDYLEPSQFGRLIRLFNWLRYWVETFVQYLVMRELLKQSRCPRADAAKFRKQFKQDIRAEVSVWKASTKEATPVLPPTFTSHMDMEVAARPTDFSDGFAKYTAPKRSQRYFRRPDPRTVHENELDPLSSEEFNGRTAQAENDVGAGQQDSGSQGQDRGEGGTVEGGYRDRAIEALPDADFDTYERESARAYSKP